VGRAWRQQTWSFSFRIKTMSSKLLLTIPPIPEPRKILDLDTSVEAYFDCIKESILIFEEKHYADALARYQIAEHTAEVMRNDAERRYHELLRELTAWLQRETVRYKTEQSEIMFFETQVPYEQRLGQLYNIEYDPCMLAIKEFGRMCMVMRGYRVQIGEPVMHPFTLNGHFQEIPLRLAWGPLPPDAAPASGAIAKEEVVLLEKKEEQQQQQPIVVEEKNKEEEGEKKVPEE
jgi:hypothetical protein